MNFKHNKIHVESGKKPIIYKPFKSKLMLNYVKPKISKNDYSTLLICLSHHPLCHYVMHLLIIFYLLQVKYQFKLIQSSDAI